jgi:O-antigen/teichoic acid export membrane protein
MSEVVLVRLTELQRDRMPRRGAILIQGVIGRLGMILVPLYVFMLVNARQVMTLLYTDRFAAAVPVFQVVLTLIPLTVVALDYVPRAFADTRFVLAVNVCRLVVTIVALAVLVGRFGAVGAAVAAVTGTAAAKGMAMMRAGSLLGVPVSRLIPWTKLAYLAGASVVAVIVASLFRDAFGTGPVALVGWLAVFTVCYGAAVWSAALNRKDREAVIGFLDTVGVRALFQRARANS